MKGSQESLTTVVVKDAANWPTVNALPASNDVNLTCSGDGRTKPNKLGWAVAQQHGQAAPANWATPAANDTNRTPEAYARAKEKHGSALQASLQVQAQLHGQAAPANPSTDGSRQGLWLTPRANEPDSDSNFVARNADRGEHCHPSLSQQAKSMWPTITAHTPDMESSGPNGNSGTYLAGAVKQWGSPRTGIRADTHFSYDRGKHNIEEQAGASMKGGGKLNPRWVETLMGLPVGWTMPSCKSPVTIEPTNSGSSATESCQQQQSELFAF
jgi:hypothetical protein